VNKKVALFGEISMLTTNNDSLLAGVTALQNDDNLFKE
jgi:hypothetical protein